VTRSFKAWIRERSDKASMFWYQLAKWAEMAPGSSSPWSRASSDERRSEVIGVIVVIVVSLFLLERTWDQVRLARCLEAPMSMLNVTAGSFSSSSPPVTFRHVLRLPLPNSVDTLTVPHPYPSRPRTTALQATLVFVTRPTFASLLRRTSTR